MRYTLKRKPDGTIVSSSRITAERLEEIRVRLSQMNPRDTAQLIRETGMKLSSKQKNIFINGTKK